MNFDKQAVKVTLHLELKDHIQLDSTPRVHKVTENVHVAVGFAMSNMIMIEGKDGIVIVDTTEAQEPALKILKEFRKITSKPIDAIILTHFHSDHTSGASALLDSCEDGGKNVRIFAHSTLHSERLKSFMASESIAFGIQRQFGVYLPEDQRLPCIGIGPLNSRSPNVGKHVIPTDTFEKELDIEIAGVQLKLLHTPGETDDQISVWIPEWKVLLPADNIYKAFPNLSTLRGAPPRNCETWYQSLDKVRYLRPQHLVPSHTNPVSGEKEIYDIITAYRDAMQFINDQTIRLLNKGFGVEDVVQMVRLPQTLASHPYLQEFYGTVSWSVRGIINGRLGWFDGNPSNIFPLSEQEKAEMYKEMCSKENDHSAIEKMLSIAEQYLNQTSEMHLDAHGTDASKKISCSLDLAQKALKLTEPESNDHKKALSIALSCLKLLSSSTKNPNARNYFLSCGMEFSTKCFVEKMGQRVLSRRLKTWPISFVMEKLRFIFKAEDCDEHDLMTVIFHFPDVNQQHSFTMRHCVLEYHSDSELIPNDFDVKVTCNSDAWRNSLTCAPTFSKFSEFEKIEGDKACLEKFMCLLDVGQSV